MNPLQVVQDVRRLRGGSQAHMMRASDGHFYATKFRGNPQSDRVLINELLASRLGRMIGLNLPESKPVYLSPWLAENSADLRFEYVTEEEDETTGEFKKDSHLITPGLHLGSRWACDPATGTTFDYLPESIFDRVKNGREFLGILLLDKWLGNADGRQTVFYRPTVSSKWDVAFVDHGYCFNAGAWDFPDLPLQGVYYRNHVYESVTGWESFEPWLSRIERLNRSQIFELAADVPAEWLEGQDWKAREDGPFLLGQLLIEISNRTSQVRDLITKFRYSSRSPFQNWKEQ